MRDYPEWWKAEHATFRDAVKARFGMSHRKACYLMRIVDALVVSDIPYSKVEHLGWSKLKELAPILTRENVDEMVALADRLTVVALRAHLKGHTPLDTVTFQVSPDHRARIDAALEHAMAELALDSSRAEDRGKALAAIMEAYLAGCQHDRD